MNFFAKLYYRLRKAAKAVQLYLVIAGPGIVVMVADNDAGGITTYAATGAKYGYNLIWFLLLLIPVAYYVQEMTVRLGAVTKRGHAEAIFDGFGAFWGWFSLIDLMIVDWLTLVTEFIGMTAALAIFGIPPWLTVVGVILLHGRHRAQRPLLDLGEDRAAVLRPQPDLHPGRLHGAPVACTTSCTRASSPISPAASTASCSSS